MGNAGHLHASVIQGIWDICWIMQVFPSQSFDLLHPKAEAKPICIIPTSLTSTKQMFQHMFRRILPNPVERRNITEKGRVIHPPEKNYLAAVRLFLLP